MSWRDKLCFKDEDLKSPEHDALVIWLFENHEKIANYLYGSDRKNFQTKTPKMEEPIANKHNTILCFIDLMLEISWEEELSGRSSLKRSGVILFEAKPKILSLGETLRQLKSYEHYFDSNYYNSTYSYARGKAVVVSPDTRFKEAIEKQGFKFVNPDDFKSDGDKNDL